MSPDDFIAELWDYAAEVPMEQHPWFQGILQHRWSRSQIILGEVQHYLRIRTNPIFFGYMAINAVSEKNYQLMRTLLENLMEELGGRRTHVDVMLQFLDEGGISREEADGAEAAPGTLAAIEMIIGCCQRRSALEGVAMLAFVESQLGGAGKISEKVYRELTGFYGFSPRAAETYRLHAQQDEGHGQRQIDAIRMLATDAATQQRVRDAVKLGLTAFTLEWDGHVQAMTRKREFWSGTGDIKMRQPEIRLK
jgi:pyrroloquinoline quinone (PQQ) biosynthesis protein C